MNFIYSWLGAAAVAAVLDYIWLGLVMTSFYQSQLAPISRKVAGVFTPHFPSIVVVYLVMGLGVAAFVLPSLGAGSSLIKAFGIGALMGFIIYAVYDFTNYAVLAHWPLKLLAVDVLWGAVVVGLTSMIVYWFK